MNRFIFHAVGQGLFYSGSLSNGFNFVYDCGTEGKQDLLYKRIDHYVAKIRAIRPTIDFAVISHLHYDHFSGIQYLDKVAPIKKIYLPYMGKDKDLIALVLASAVSSNDEDSTDYQEPISVFHFVFNLYSMEDRRNVVFVGEEAEQTDFNVSVKSESVCLDKEKNFFWKFLFFNNPLSAAELIKYATKLKDYIQINGIRDFKAYVETAINHRDFNEIQKIYTYVFGTRNINSTSISMLHYPCFPPKNIGIRSYNLDIFGDYFLRNSWHYPKTKDIPSISLLTGDAEFDINMWQHIEKSLPKSNAELLIAQVPHHGSYPNWHAMELCKINCKRYVIPFGFGNSYKHPNKQTILSLMSSDCKIFIATQVHSLEYIILT